MIHTPQMDAAFLTLIHSQTNLKFSDSSYFNEVCDSIENKELDIKIYFPNVQNPFDERERASGESFNSFTLYFAIDDAELKLEYGLSIIELVYLLNALQWRIQGDDYECTMLEYMKANNEDWDVIQPLLSLQVDDEYTHYLGAAGTSNIKRIE